MNLGFDSKYNKVDESAFEFSNEIFNFFIIASRKVHIWRNTATCIDLATFKIAHKLIVWIFTVELNGDT